jgi:hypothetical protein
MPTLTVAHVRNAKAREKPYKLFDELGLFLLVTPNADTRKGRLWRLRYRYGDVEKLLSLGNYPDVPLKRAREKRDEARRLLADGVDPSVHRKAIQDAKAETFEAIAREWLAMRCLRASARHAPCTDNLPSALRGRVPAIDPGRAARILP